MRNVAERTPPSLTCTWGHLRFRPSARIRPRRRVSAACAAHPERVQRLVYQEMILPATEEHSQFPTAENVTTYVWLGTSTYAVPDRALDHRK